MFVFYIFGSLKMVSDQIYLGFANFRSVAIQSTPIIMLIEEKRSKLSEINNWIKLNDVCIGKVSKWPLRWRLGFDHEKTSLKAFYGKINVEIR